MTESISFRTWIAVVGATLGAFMAILNVHVVSASIADVRGAIGAGVDDGVWITTAYLIAEIVAIPLSGWLSRVFSIRRYLLVNVVLFLGFSVACAFARDLGQMIVLRALQGFCGGVLIPVSFALVVTLLPASRRAIGMALFSLACTLGPSIGPTIGGMLSEAWGWQAVFALNIVPGVAMLAMLWFSLERQPMQLGLLRQGDWAGIAAVAIGLAALQTVLEEGEKEDWLGSPFIARLAVVAVLSLGLFVWIELTTAHPLVNLRLLGRRNFAGGAIGMFLVGAACYGTVFALPLYLAKVQDYNAMQIGQVVAWNGLPQFLVIPLMPRLMRLVDARLLIALGFGLFATSNFMNVTISADVAGDQLMLSNVVRAIGQALVMTPLTTLATVGIEAENVGSASVLLNVLCNVGGAIGIALLKTFLARREYFHRNVLAPSISLFDEDTRNRLDQLVRYFQGHGIADPGTALNKAMAVLGDRLHEQAYVLAFGDVFFVLGIALVAAMLATLLMRKPAAPQGGQG